MSDILRDGPMTRTGKRVDGCPGVAIVSPPEDDAADDRPSTDHNAAAAEGL